VFFACRGFFAEPEGAEDATHGKLFRAHGTIRSFQRATLCMAHESERV
jgi:hypothetical protein